MKTIHKLVLKAYLGPMVLTFFIVMFVLMMNIVWRYIDELVGKGLSAGIIIELMTYFMANMIPLGLPLAMLLAAIMTMGNLGENYELLAMKSAGMSLVRITKPLIILVSVIAVGSFFIGNNLVPYANKKVYSIIYDIRQQKQSLEFQDGLFFNGIDNMSIRVSRQEPETHLLRDVLIYDNRIADGNMNTIVADSGYIRLSDDKRFLLVTLFNGEMYEQTRNSQWFTQSRLRHHIFDKQDQTIPMEGFAMQRSDANQFSNSQTKNINELQQDIDSLEILVNNATTRSYEPLLKEQIGHRKFFNPSSQLNVNAANDAAVFNEILNEKMRQGVSNIRRKMYITFSVSAPTVDDAVPKLARIENQISQILTSIGSKSHVLDGA